MAFDPDYLCADPACPSRAIIRDMAAEYAAEIERLRGVVNRYGNALADIADITDAAFADGISVEMTRAEAWPDGSRETSESATEGEGNE